MRYENFFFLHDTVSISYRIEVLYTCENGVERIGLIRTSVNGRLTLFEKKTVSCQVTQSQFDMKPIRYEMKRYRVNGA